MSRPTVEGPDRPLAARFDRVLAGGHCTFPDRLAAYSARSQTSHYGGRGHGWPGAVSFGIVLGLALTVVWSVTGAHYFWPGWIWFTLALPIRRLPRHPLGSAHSRPALIGPRSRHLPRDRSDPRGHLGVMSSHHYFWPIWPILGLGVVLAGHALLVSSAPNSREQALSERVDVLTRTRKDALRRPGGGDASGRT